MAKAVPLTSVAPGSGPLSPLSEAPLENFVKERPALTLAIDVGGTGLKAGVLDPSGIMASGPERVDTPKPSGPAVVVAEIIGLIGKLGAFDRISVGFPGVVRHGHVITAPNLGTDVWHGFPLAEELSRRLNRPTRILNDATVQGLGASATPASSASSLLVPVSALRCSRTASLAPTWSSGSIPSPRQRPTTSTWATLLCAKWAGRSGNKATGQSRSASSTRWLRSTRLLIGGGKRPAD